MSKKQRSLVKEYWPVATVNFTPLSDPEIEYINNLQGNTWKAGRNAGFEDVKTAKTLLGIDMEANELYNKLHLSYPEIFYAEDDLPDQFDSRTKWSNCKTMKEIRDQSNCGSCWAFGSVEAMSDRICVAQQGNVHLSAEDVLSCCENCGNGCSGGYPTRAYQYWVRDGVVSGGVYGSKKGCYPYEVAPCHTPTPNCSHECPTPKCHHQCIPGYSKSYSEDKHFGAKSYGVRGVQNIMKELVNNGPVTAAFTVYSDFMHYKSGVYKHKTGGQLGGHAVKIIGYGTENGQDYWLVANSWTTSWGDKGYFKIAKGNNECSIESYIVTGIPKQA
ncbi:hypothetical protein RRG08_018637 [Elysia crispata]|uniref:Cathepsin B-like cysteine proteinase n=1 Tax=Elysia crispata TaxID=231223 RepID=A0AAE1D7K3_9GAST|nr:hypothetical protein RRG08_018637 [Elysia crispata]